MKLPFYNKLGEIQCWFDLFLAGGKFAGCCCCCCCFLLLKDRKKEVFICIYIYIYTTNIRTYIYTNFLSSIIKEIENRVQI